MAFARVIVDDLGRLLAEPKHDDGSRHEPGCQLWVSREPRCGGSFECGTCGALVGWCWGAWDDHPEDCDACANAHDKMGCREEACVGECGCDVAGSS